MSHLRTLRLVAGLRQSDLAERAHCSRETIRLLEAGQQRPQLGTAKQIAEALRVSNPAEAAPEVPQVRWPGAPVSAMFGASARGSRWSFTVWTDDLLNVGVR